nr:spermatid-specific linker histone H1-like protein [Microcebus murinus]
MQKDTSQLPTSAPRASSTAMSGGRQASVSGVSSKSEAGHRSGSKSHQKPTISKVILKTVADKGVGKRVSLATLKKAVATMGYNMARNTRYFKRVLKGLVDTGKLKQVTGKGALGSFCMGKNQAFKSKLQVKRRRQQQQRRSGQRRPGQRRSGQRRAGRRRSPLGSRQGHRRPFKRACRGAKGRYH